MSDNQAVVVVMDDSRLAPSERDTSFAAVVQSVMNAAQYEILTGKVPAYAIKYKEKGGVQMPYLPHGYTRDQLNKAFGFDWDWELLPVFNGSIFHQGVMTEKRRGGEVVEVPSLCVAGKLTVRFRDPDDAKVVIATIVKEDVGSQPLRGDMEFGDALKGASSDALKRCGISLGIGLGLYYDDTAKRAEFEQRKAQQAELQREQELRMQARGAAADGASPREIAQALGIEVAKVKQYLA